MSVEVLLTEEVLGNIFSSSTLLAHDDSEESTSVVDSLSDFPEIFSTSSTPTSQFLDNLAESLAASACQRYSFECDLSRVESSGFEVDIISDASNTSLQDDINFEVAVDCVSACLFDDFETESVISDLEGYMEIEDVSEELLNKVFETAYEGDHGIEEEIELPKRKRLSFAMIQESFLASFGLSTNSANLEEIPTVSYGSPKRQSAMARRNKKMIPVIASTGVADLRHFAGNNEGNRSARTIMKEEIAELEDNISGMRSRLEALHEKNKPKPQQKQESVDEIEGKLMKERLWMRNARDVLQRYEKMCNELRDVRSANLVESSAFKNVLLIETSRLKQLEKERDELVTLIYFQREEHGKFLKWIEEVKKRNLKPRYELEERLRKIRKRYLRRENSVNLPSKMSKKASEKVKAETKRHVERINRVPRQL